MKRKCIVCKRNLDLTQFYESKKLSEGHTYVCKECNSLLCFRHSVKRRIKQKGIDALQEEIRRETKRLKIKKEIVKEYLSGVDNTK